MSSASRPTILFVSMPGAIHTGRWIDQLTPKDWDIHLFAPQASSDLTIHDTVPNAVTLHLVMKQQRARIRQTGIPFPVDRGDRVRLAVTNLYERFQPRTERLAKLIRKIRPDIIHSMEIVGAGYLTLAAKEIFESRGEKFPPWIYSSWGNDLFMYGPMPDHAAKIRRVLGKLDYMFTDCDRDKELARDYGFQGELLGTFPTGGGFPVMEMQKFADDNVAARKLVAVKGIIRHDNQGRALVALDGIAKSSDALAGYEVVIYSADPPVVEKAAAISDKVKITCLPAMSHEEFIKMMGRTKISIGMNVSDGSPNTMLESMMMGAFPIQSDTVSTGEWITDGVNGLLVDPDDADGLADAIRRAVADDTLLESAAEANRKMMREQLERDVVSEKVIGIYERILAGQR